MLVGTRFKPCFEMNSFLNCVNLMYLILHVMNKKSFEILSALGSVGILIFLMILVEETGLTPEGYIISFLLFILLVTLLGLKLVKIDYGEQQ